MAFSPFSGCVARTVTALPAESLGHRAGRRVGHRVSSPSASLRESTRSEDGFDRG